MYSFDLFGYRLTHTTLVVAHSCLLVRNPISDLNIHMYRPI